MPLFEDEDPDMIDRREFLQVTLTSAAGFAVADLVDAAQSGASDRSAVVAQIAPRHGARKNSRPRAVPPTACVPPRPSITRFIAMDQCGTRRPEPGAPHARSISAVQPPVAISTARARIGKGGDPGCTDCAITPATRPSS